VIEIKRIFILLLVSLMLIINIKVSALGFGLSNIGENKRPNAGSYKNLIENNGGVYIGSDSKEIYLTFDCGYENGYTLSMLDTLKENDVKAIFFITGHYLKSSKDIVRRMIDDGHLIGNHTFFHKDFSKSSNNDILEDIKHLEIEFKKDMGVELSKYVRPPRGDFDERSLKLLNENGYKSVFWSLAYVDWDKHKFNGNDYSYNNVKRRIHNGAIILMHTVSKDNENDLDKIIKTLKNDGYVFKSINNMI
jgi:peptidoglycan-N-acetylmuramic acid deacetylase